jgi:hypothetical protein
LRRATSVTTLLECTALLQWQGQKNEEVIKSRTPTTYGSSSQDTDTGSFTIFIGNWFSILRKSSRGWIRFASISTVWFARRSFQAYRPLLVADASLQSGACRPLTVLINPRSDCNLTPAIRHESIPLENLLGKRSLREFLHCIFLWDRKAVFR